MRAYYRNFRSCTLPLLSRIAMIKPNLLKDLAAQLSSLLPSHLGSLRNDFEKNCRIVLTKALAKFDLVTREEFDTQTKVLLRTRKKLEELEKLLQELESKLKLKSKQAKK